MRPKTAPYEYDNCHISPMPCESLGMQCTPWTQIGKEGGDPYWRKSASEKGSALILPGARLNSQQPSCILHIRWKDSPTSNAKLLNVSLVACSLWELIQFQVGTQILLQRLPTLTRPKTSCLQCLQSATRGGPNLPTLGTCDYRFIRHKVVQMNHFLLVWKPFQ